MSDLISRRDALKPFCIAPDGTRIPEVDCDNFPVEFSVEFIKKHLLSLPSADRPTTDCTKFLEWLKAEVLDEENWELNAVANGEIICRKLKKLGLLDVKDGYYVETQKTGKWIPIKWHEITEEEREREGYPKDWVVYIDCDMPCDGDEILVQTKNGYIRWDVCYEDGELSLDSGWDWIEDIVAWMPLPEPYREGGGA